MILSYCFSYDTLPFISIAIIIQIGITALMDGDTHIEELNLLNFKSLSFIKINF